MTPLLSYARLPGGLVRLLLLLLGARIDLAPPRWRMRTESVTDDPFLDHRGIYAWYGDARALGRLRRAGVEGRGGGGLVYVGKTTGSFRRRVLQRHIAGTSTLRKTLRGLLIKTGSTAARADADVSSFMRAHLRVAMIPMSTVPRCLIDATERRLIRKCSPLLNVTHNPNSESVRSVRRFARARGGRRGWVRRSSCWRLFR